MSTREIFKENLKFFRKQKGITQEKLSEMIGFSVTYITEIESRHKFPKPETIDLIAEKLGIEPYQLFQKLSCPENIKQFAQNDFIAQLSEKLSTDIQSQITQSISDVFKS